MTRTNGSLAMVFVNTTQNMILYRQFVIQESWKCWEWTHESFETNGVTGDCQTMFECIDAVDRWHEERDA